MYCVETRDLRHRYSTDEPVLNGIALQVPEGSIYGFLGPNGAGKTTTLRLLLGLLKTRHGSVSIFQKPLGSNRARILRNVGSLIEGPSLYDHLTAAENLTVLQRVYRCPKSRIAEVLEMVGLPNTAKKKVREFSLGMKQRLSIAVALLHNPPLLILDEPTNGLDPNGVIEMRKLLTRLNAELGVTILISSHLLAEIEKLVTHVGILHRGTMVFQGTMDELKRKQQQILSICLGTNDDEAALRIVAELVPSVRMVEGKIVVPAMPNESIAAINRVLIERGLEVHEIRAVNKDLEAIFMGLVTESSP